MTRRVFFIAHGGEVQGSIYLSLPILSKLSINFANARTRDPGVGFRFFTQKRAQEYGVTGWCRNTPDNKVEGEAQGDDAALEKFLKDVGNGPRHATVVKLTREDRDVMQGEKQFRICH